ncbi:type VI secretion system-associated protein TagO [Vreelandella profundi]|uniref:type VI secretion system-associated protein TagO n=1 Tax=Vreelandella profundi TaxID=2852117 RepID=UPI001F3F5D8F|nr:type VI secretion system-associated protein TagO [Halomonas profundi]
MGNLKVIGTIVAGVFIVGFLLNDDGEETEPTTRNTARVVSVSEAEQTPNTDVDTNGDNQEPAKPTPPPAPASPWRVSEEISPMDDSKSVFLTTRSNEAIPGRYGRSTARPTLYVRCVENTTALVLHMDGHHMASSQYHNWGHVEMRIDDGRVFTKAMRQSTNNRSLGLWSGGESIPVIRQMFGAERLIMRATPYSESAMTMTFNISQLEDEIAPLREACHW